MQVNPSRPSIILLTGGLACGKTTVAKLLEEQGAVIIDTDQIARSLLSDDQECIDAVLAYFGKSIVLPDSPQAINRKKLRELIFQDLNKKKWLENLLHPRIRKIALDKVEQVNNLPSPPSKIIIVIPLLASRETYPADKILTIESPYDLQIKRVMKRDHISETLAKQMIQSQPASEQRRKIADFIIFNDEALEAQGIQGLKKTLEKLKF